MDWVGDTVPVDAATGLFAIGKVIYLNFLKNS